MVVAIGFPVASGPLVRHGLDMDILFYALHGGGFFVALFLFGAAIYQLSYVLEMDRSLLPPSFHYRSLIAAYADLAFQARLVVNGWGESVSPEFAGLISKVRWLYLLSTAVAFGSFTAAWNLPR
jgi:hypothetical protein